MLLCLYLLLIGALSAVAAPTVEDPRMSVWVTYEDGIQLSMPEAISKALPILWNRVLLQSSRDLVSDTMNATSFLLRAIPKSDGVYIAFNPARVWQYLEKKEIAFIREPLRASLLIKVLNQHGVNMSESSLLLKRHAAWLAENHGIVLDSQAPALVLSWRWVNQQQFNLTVRGHPNVPERSEMRELLLGDPQIQLKLWLKEVLLQSRDASILAVPLNGEAIDPLKVAQDVSLKLMLSIERNAALPEQVGLEEALRKHPQVIALTPKYISVDNQQYKLHLKDQYDSWLAAWLAKYGLQAMKIPAGWLAK